MTQRTTQHATIMKSSKRRWRATAAASLAAVTAATLGLAAAPTASAAPALPCLYQDFGPGNHECTVAAGETILFSIKSGDGGAGADDSGPGGAGGAGLVVTGTYTNLSGSTQTLTVQVGSNGADGMNADGTNGTLSSIGILPFTNIVEANPGTKGNRGTPGGNGAAGTPGTLAFPGSLPDGWIATTMYGIPFARFSQYFPPPSSAASGPADLLQQVEVPASGSCADVKDSDLKWGTDLTGGWSKAWGEWANRFVCSRTFHYGANGWEISPA